MASSLNKSKLSIDSAVVAYLLAVTSAAISFPLLRLIFVVLAILRSSGLDVSTALGRLGGMQFHPIYMLVEALFIWVFVLFSAIPPFVLGIAIARHFEIFHWGYFVLCGVLAAASSSLVISFLSLGTAYPYQGFVFLERYILALPNYIACGAIAGAVCWLYLRRNFQ